MADRTYRWLLVSLAVIGLSADQVSKYGVFRWLYRGREFGGTVGNLYDRLVFGGVRDFLHVHHNSFDWPVFNVADCCLVVGAALLLFQAVFVPPKPEEPAAPEDEAVVPEGPKA